MNIAQRRSMSIAVIVGGLIGLFLSQMFGWSALQTFVITLIIAGGCAALAAAVYNALDKRK